MTTPAEYVLQLKAKLAISPIVASFDIVEEKVWPDRGYICIRMALSNGDFLEAAEYFVLEDEDCVTHRYRYQWMGSAENCVSDGTMSNTIPICRIFPITCMLEGRGTSSPAKGLASFSCWMYWPARSRWRRVDAEVSALIAIGWAKEWAKRLWEPGHTLPAGGGIGGDKNGQS